MLPDSLARLDSWWFLYYKVSFERFSLQFIQAPSFFWDSLSCKLDCYLLKMGSIYTSRCWQCSSIVLFWMIFMFTWFARFFLWAYWLNSSVWSVFLLYCVLYLSHGVKVLHFFLLFLHRLSNAIFTVLSLYRPSMTYQYCFKCHVIEVAIYALLWSWMEWLRCTVFLITAYWVVMLVNVEMAP